MANEIIPGLWQGDATDAANWVGYDAIVACRAEAEDLDYGMGVGKMLLWVPMIDLETPPNFTAGCLDVASDFLVAALGNNAKVLVHCQMGINRASLVNGYFLIIQKKMVPNAAIALIREKRPGALSNAVFVDFLMSLRE